MKNTASFNNCVKYIADEYACKFPNPETQAETWISLFLRRTILDYLNGTFNPQRDITKYVVIFMRDLEGGPIEWEIKVWLEGIWLKIDKLEIEKGIIIRKPCAEDLEYEYPLFSPPPETVFIPPSAILEIRKRDKIQPFIYPELERLIIALQLYKVGSVVKSRIYWKPQSFIHFGGTSNSPRLWATTFKYCLDEEDKDRLPQFVKEIKNKIPIDERGRPLSRNPLGIAIMRYQDALLKPEPIENKVAYAVMGLEALYLRGEEREELSRRLAQRVAKIQSILGEKPIKVYRILLKAYDVRSRFVHGSVFPDEERQKVREILNSIVEYLKKSIIVFMRLPKGKDKVLSLVDNAILDKQADEKLTRLIRENITSLF